MSEAAADTSGSAAVPEAEPEEEPLTPLRRLGSTRKIPEFNVIRQQMVEQQRWLETRAEAQAGLLAELQEHCRRRGDLEAEYARALDKLAARGLQAPGGLAEAAAARARDHAALARLLRARLAGRLRAAAARASRLARRARGLLSARQAELAGALHEAAAAAKLRAAAVAELRVRAAKLRAASSALARARPRAGSPHKLRRLETRVARRTSRAREAHADAARARTAHEMALASARAALDRYYADDIAEIMDCMDVGVQAVLARSLTAQAAAERQRALAAGAAADTLLACAASLDGAADRQRYRSSHPHAFSPPRRLLALEAPEDADEPEAAGAEAEAAGAEAEARLSALRGRAERAAREVCAAAAARDRAEAELVARIEGAEEEWDVHAGGDEPEGGHDARDLEDVYLQRVNEYQSAAGRSARLHAAALALGGAAAEPSRDGLPVLLVSTVRVLQASAQPGLFRVPGAAPRVQRLRAAFAGGEDPLRDAGADLAHAAAGVLKLWLRERAPPLIPPRAARRLCALPEDDPAEFVSGARAVLESELPAGSLRALRFLLRFLHELSLRPRARMDAHNLGVCLGPSLLPAPHPRPAAQERHNSLLAALIHHHVLHREEDGDRDDWGEWAAWGEGDGADGEEALPDEGAPEEQGEQPADPDPSDDSADDAQETPDRRRPDLVRDLPAAAPGTPPAPPPRTTPAGPPCVPGGVGAGAAAGGVTAVAAKFAALHLTGGGKPDALSAPAAPAP